MEKPSTARNNEKRSQKTCKKKPVKVVYISNPMKIKATPSEFRAVVQQLTGKYATSPPPEGPAATVAYKDDVDEVGAGSSFLHYQDKWQSKRTGMDTSGSDLYDGSSVMDNLITPQMFEGFPSQYVP